MENNEQTKSGRAFGFTAVKTTDEKIDDLQNPAVKDVINGKEEPKERKSKDGNLDVSKIISTKLDAMEKFNLQPKTIGIKALLEENDDINFTLLSKILRKDKQELASDYVLEGIQRDMKKYNLSINKK